MAAVGGSIESVTLDGRIFPVAFDADVARKLGGFENENLLNGDGSSRLIKTRTAWSLSGIPLENDDSRGDHTFVQALADRNDYFPIAITYASGITNQGTGQISGEMSASSQSATLTLDLSGPGSLTQQ